MGAKLLLGVDSITAAVSLFHAFEHAALYNEGLLHCLPQASSYHYFKTETEAHLPKTMENEFLKMNLVASLGYHLLGRHLRCHADKAASTVWSVIPAL